MREGLNQQARKPRGVRPITSKHGHHPPPSSYTLFETENVISLLISLSVYSQRMRTKERGNEGAHHAFIEGNDRQQSEEVSEERVG
jgi:hypothetical protein